MKNIRFFALIYLTLFTTASLAAEPESSNTISNQAAAFLATNAKYHVVIGVLVLILLIYWEWVLINLNLFLNFQ